MIKQYIPRNDGLFNEWQHNLMSIVNDPDKQLAWHIPIDKVDALLPLQSVWQKAYTKTTNKKTRNSAEVEEKNQARDRYEKELRIFVQSYLAKNSSVSDADRERLGITVPSPHHHRAAPISYVPEMRRIESAALRHTLYWEDNTSKSKAHPEGVEYCEIWRCISNADAPAPASTDDYEYVDMETKHSHTIEYGSADVGKAAHYILRWGNKEFKGAWSPDAFQIITR